MPIHRKKFITPLAFCSDPHYPTPPYVTRKWKLRAVDARRNNLPEPSVLCSDGAFAKQVIIESNDLKTAINAMQLVHACYCVVSAGDFFAELDQMASLVREKTLNIDIPRASYYPGSPIQPAFVMATRAADRSAFQYSLYHLFNSYQLFSIPWRQTDPYHSENLPKPTLRNADPILTRVTYAHAISLAYQSIEELVGPASRSANGVSDETKNRLIGTFARKGIKYPRSFLWILRGAKTFLELGRSTVPIRKPAWSELPSVRDEEVDLVDAICDASFLRNKVSAHKLSAKDFHKRVKTLSVYDVFNVQSLARHLLIMALKVPLLPKKRSATSLARRSG